MRAIERTLDPASVPERDLRSVLPGDTFVVEAERAYTFVVTGMAAVDAVPAWWPDGTPTDPTNVVSTPGSARPGDR
jgi:hypothetical protein